MMPAFLLTFAGWIALTALAFVGSTALIRRMSGHAQLEAAELFTAIVRWSLVAFLLGYGLLDSWQRAGGDPGQSYTVVILAKGYQARAFDGGLQLAANAPSVYDLSQPISLTNQ